MSETRKIHQSDGEQQPKDDHVALDGEKEFRSSKLSLSKLKEKASPDGAHEKLLQKEDEARIARDMRVDIVDAKFVSGDHRNGDPKIELDANKRQFSGLTKEELMKYADDPFWVNIRWCLFVLFWALWLGMLAGAITIIVRAPKCASAPARTWYEKGPLVEVESHDYAEVESELPLLQSSKVQGIFMELPVSAYDALDKPDALEKFKAFVETAKKYGIKVIVDLIPNYVSVEHPWFQQRVNISEYHDYFVWADVLEYDGSVPKPPNNWVSTLNTSAWTFDETLGKFYLHQFAADQPDLNFNNKKVVELFTAASQAWVKAGAHGVRLNKARLMLVNTTALHKSDESPASGKGASPGAGHDQYAFWRHRHTADQPGLDPLLNGLATAMPGQPEETVFTLKEEGDRPELFLLARNVTLRPASAAPIAVSNATAAATQLNDRISNGRWPIIPLQADPGAERELAAFALLLPAAPLLNLAQLDNDTTSGSLSHLVALRDDASIEHGHHTVATVGGLIDGTNTSVPLLACARWKAGHTGYVAVFNPSVYHLRANLTALPTVPEALTVHHISHEARTLTNYTSSPERADSVLVPSKSTVVFSYVPLNTAEN